MAEENKNEQHSICSNCRSKCINDEEHINNDFGYTILEMIYKTSARCRPINKIKCKTYHEKHPEQAKEYYEAHKEENQEYNKQFREKHADRLNEHDRARDQIKVYCPHCNGEIVKRKLSSHLRSQKCKKKPHTNDTYIIVGGRVYLKGESPLEGAWHRDHTPFEVKHYAILENNIPRSVAITTVYI